MDLDLSPSLQLPQSWTQNTVLEDFELGWTESKNFLISVTAEQSAKSGDLKFILDSNENEIIILSFGSLLESAILAGEKLNARIVDMQFVKPIDHELSQDISDNYKLIVTLEDNVVAGGAGSAVNELLIKLDSKARILNLGLPDEFIEHGDQEQQKVLNGLDGEGVEKSIRQKLNLI